MKEDLRIKSNASLEKTGNIETEANELLRRNKIDIPTRVHFKTMLKTMIKTMFKTMFKPWSKPHSKSCSKKTIAN